MPIVTLTTDFGAGSRYVAQLKGVLLSRAPGVTLVDLSHDILPQDVVAGARLIEQSAPWFPEGTVHLAVVDPGVGSGRKIVAIQYEDHFFVGPDNGLFGWLADEAEEIVALDSERFNPMVAAATFHGRDLMAPAAAELAIGAELSTLGMPQETLVTLPSEPGPAKSPGQIAGRIVEVDNFGNLITNIKQAALGDAPLDDRLRIACGGREIIGLQRTYSDQSPQTLVALVGSNGYLEVATVNGDAALELDAEVGEPVVITWEV